MRAGGIVGVAAKFWNQNSQQTDDLQSSSMGVADIKGQKRKEMEAPNQAVDQGVTTTELFSDQDGNDIDGSTFNADKEVLMNCMVTETNKES